MYINNTKNSSLTKKNLNLVCPLCKSRRVKQDPKWDDNECLNCKKIWNK